MPVKCDRINCIMCTHFNFDPGFVGYSELTPGEEWVAYCFKNHWNLSGYKPRTDEWRKTITKAESCSDFELVEF